MFCCMSAHFSVQFTNFCAVSDTYIHLDVKKEKQKQKKHHLQFILNFKSGLE